MNTDQQPTEQAHCRGEPPLTDLETPVQYIYSSMMTNPVSNTPVELVGLGKRHRSGERSGSLRSMDHFIRSEDFDLFSGRLKSADIVEGLLKSEQSPAAATEKERRLLGLAAKLERISTADRLSSGEWVRDFRNESLDLAPMNPSLFADASALYQEYQVPLSAGNEELPAMPPLPPLGTVMKNLHNTTSSERPSSSTTSKKKKKRRKRVIDESRAVEPTDDDVLFGRGGYSNKHPGNIRYRAKALELRSWYEQPGTSKEEKYRISELLVESVTNEGHRFLEKGKDGLWHEVIGNGARKKASQALRERIKRRRK